MYPVYNPYYFCHEYYTTNTYLATLTFIPPNHRLLLSCVHTISSHNYVTDSIPMAATATSIITTTYLTLHRPLYAISVVIGSKCVLADTAGWLPPLVLPPITSASTTPYITTQLLLILITPSLFNFRTYILCQSLLEYSN